VDPRDPGRDVDRVPGQREIDWPALGGARFAEVDQRRRVQREHENVEVDRRDIAVAGAIRVLAFQLVVPLVDFTIDEDSGGELLVRGPWVASAYFEDDSQKEKFEGGWLRTGDVAQLSDGSYIKLVDRTKDLVKSGGEWISSVELENVVMGHPKVMEAAVIAVPDEQWGERPCACVVPCEGEDLGADELREFLAERVAKWWIPERIEFIDEVPKTSVGKFDKKVLRRRLAEEAASDSAS